MAKIFALTLIFPFIATVAAFPTYATSGLSTRSVFPPPPPGPSNDTSTKLVYDSKHPYVPPGPDDRRGPCPALNTLANHGYLPHNGIVTPTQIINAVQDGFNMGNDAAILLAYYTHLVVGNQLTDMFSIGLKSPLTGPDPPAPAYVAGMATHQVFEGDGSLSRGDAFFGNNYDFNAQIFEQGFLNYSQIYGGGRYNYTVAAELRYARMLESMAVNPIFTLYGVRYLAGWVEPILPIMYFDDGRYSKEQVSLNDSTSLFQGKFPDGFHRANRSIGLSELVPAASRIFHVHPLQPGSNNGAGNFIVDTSNPAFGDICGLYGQIVNDNVKGIYPNPTGALLSAINANLNYLYQGVFKPAGCTQIFPY